jgi:circadian clock protein KaiB
VVRVVLYADSSCRSDEICADEPLTRRVMPPGADKAMFNVTTRLLRLYVAGSSASSVRAQTNLQRLRDLMPPAWTVEVVDVVANPDLAEQAGILATPTLSCEHSARPRRIVGDLSDAKRVMAFLGIEPERNDA